MKYQDLFGDKKPVMGMVHLNSFGGSVLENAQEEIEIYLANGVYPLIENYYGSTDDCEEVLAWMHTAHPEAVYGVNILGNYEKAFDLAAKYGAKFVQIDSVCGHLAPQWDEAYAAALQQTRSKCDVVLLGGVRFKCQPVYSGRSVEEDLKLGMERCDAIVCTGEGTGLETPEEKVEYFKAVVDSFPVVVGAGVTLDTVALTVEKSDGAIVGSWFKEGHNAKRPLRAEYVEQFMLRWNA